MEQSPYLKVKNLAFPLQYKGGVGKTVVVADAALCCGENNYRVAAMDFDPQESLRWTLDPKPNPVLGLKGERAGAYEREMQRRYEHWHKILVESYSISDLAKDQATAEIVIRRMWSGQSDVFFHDYPPLQQDRIVANIVPLQMVFEGGNVFPLLVTEPTRTQIRVVTDLYKWYRDAVAGRFASIKPIIVLNKTDFKTQDRAEWLYGMDLGEDFAVVCLPYLQREGMDTGHYSVRLDSDFEVKANSAERLEEDAPTVIGDAGLDEAPAGHDVPGISQALGAAREYRMNVYTGEYWPGIRSITQIISGVAGLLPKIEEGERKPGSERVVELHEDGSIDDIRGMFGGGKRSIF